MYLKVIKDILNYYSENLTKEELLQLSNIISDKNYNEDNLDDNTIIFINSVLNKIWEQTLTSPQYFKNGNNFCFLVKTRDIVSSAEYGIIKDVNESTVSLLTNDTLDKYDMTTSGYIIKLDYTSNKRTTPILPIYLKDNKMKIDNFNYILLGTYYIEPNLEEPDIEKDYLIEESKKLNIKNILLDKMLYNKLTNKKIIDKEDIYKIIILFIVNYENIEFFKQSIFYKKQIITNKDIHKEIMKYYRGKITKEELTKNIHNLFNDILSNELDKKKNKVI